MSSKTRKNKKKVTVIYTAVEEKLILPFVYCWLVSF